MTNINKIIWSAVGAIILVSVIYLGPGIVDYINFKNVAESAGGMPAQDAGRIVMVKQPCILDTPASAPATCAASCPLVTSALASACTGYIELDTQSQQGTVFIAAPIGFIYKGGGKMPTAGMQYIYGGASNAIPWVIGIPSVAALRTQKIIDWFDYAIASFRDKIIR
jgi:hypothetical protein